MFRAIRFALPGLIVAGLGRMSATGRLPRNVFAGIRIPSTMRSDEAWRAGHHAAALALTAAGSGPVAVAIFAGAKRPGRGTEKLLFRIGTGWLLAWIGVATFQANRAARDIDVPG